MSIWSPRIQCGSLTLDISCDTYTNHRTMPTRFCCMLTYVGARGIKPGEQVRLTAARSSEALRRGGRDTGKSCNVSV